MSLIKDFYNVTKFPISNTFCSFEISIHQRKKKYGEKWITFSTEILSSIMVIIIRILK